MYPSIFFGFPSIYTLVFFVMLGIILVRVIRKLVEWSKNNDSPVLTVDAIVVTKRTNTSVSHSHTNNHAMSTHTNTSYYVTFEVESKDRIEFHVSGQEYGMLVEGDLGRLTFQGTRYKGFERL